VTGIVSILVELRVPDSTLYSNIPGSERNRELRTGKPLGRGFLFALKGMFPSFFPSFYFCCVCCVRSRCNLLQALSLNLMQAHSLFHSVIAGVGLGEEQPMGFTSKVFCAIMVVCGLNVISIGGQFLAILKNIEVSHCTSLSQRKFHGQHQPLLFISGNGLAPKSKLDCKRMLI
jgi:hypothetical protein